jgi:hypothetical protein
VGFLSLFVSSSRISSKGELTLSLPRRHQYHLGQVKPRPEHRLPEPLCVFLTFFSRCRYRLLELILLLGRSRRHSRHSGLAHGLDVSFSRPSLLDFLVSAVLSTDRAVSLNDVPFILLSLFLPTYLVVTRSIRPGSLTCTTTPSPRSAETRTGAGSHFQLHISDSLRNPTSQSLV